MKLCVRKDIYNQINKSLFNASEHPRGIGGKFIKKLAPNTGVNSSNLSDVKHEGDYVLNKDGTKDFGEITEEIAKIIGRQAGKIRLRKGYHSDNSNDKREKYGEIHIERPDRLKQLKEAGFDNARDYVDYVGKNYNSIYKGGGRTLIICARENIDHTLYVKLEPSDNGDFYDVKTTMITRKSFLDSKKKKEALLWEKP